MGLCMPQTPTFLKLYHTKLGAKTDKAIYIFMNEITIGSTVWPSDSRILYMYN